jgi:hypothetical protein
LAAQGAHGDPFGEHAVIDKRRIEQRGLAQTELCQGVIELTGVGRLGVADQAQNGHASAGG